MSKQAPELYLELAPTPGFNLRAIGPNSLRGLISGQQEVELGCRLTTRLKNHLGAYPHFVSLPHKPIVRVYSCLSQLNRPKSRSFRRYPTTASPASKPELLIWNIKKCKSVKRVNTVKAIPNLSMFVAHFATPILRRDHASNRLHATLLCAV